SHSARISASGSLANRPSSPSCVSVTLGVPPAASHRESTGSISRSLALRIVRPDKHQTNASSGPEQPADSRECTSCVRPHRKNPSRLYAPMVPISSECAGAVQTTHKISGDQAQGYATYLTSTSSRGDYYTGDGEVQAGSRWHGSQTMLASLGLEPDGHVGRDELRALMQGVSPLDGAELRRAGGNGTRVAGIDLTFSAPKSVSALWAVSSPDDRAQIEAAHSRAVAGAVARAEREVELVRRRRDGKLQWQKADRLLAAEFVHTASRLTRDQERGGVPDPQLHSHVVVLGAERGDGRLVAVDSRELFRSARANGAWYRAELAHHLQGLGLEVRGRTGRGERYFELGGVPPALSERWSGRSSEIERAARRFRTRYGRDPRGGELGSLTQATRGGKTVTAAVDVDAAWRAVGEEYGLTREALERMRTERSPQNDHAALAGEL